MREGKDRGGKWLIEHYGDALLHLAGINGFETWRAIQPQVVQQGRTPDGLLEVVFPGEKEPVLVLLEIYTYPAKNIPDEILRDVLFVYLDRGIVPEVVSLFLHPKGKVKISGELGKTSRLGMTAFTGRWRVINLWEIKAKDLLATHQVGLIPWVPLADFDGPAEILLQQCREEIESYAPKSEWSNLLAITQIMASMRYDINVIGRLFGGIHMLAEQNPLLRLLFAEKTAQLFHKLIIEILDARFDSVPKDLVSAIRAIKTEKKLDSLFRYAVKCPSLDTFRDRIGPGK